MIVALAFSVSINIACSLAMQKTNLKKKITTTTTTNNALCDDNDDDNADNDNRTTTFFLTTSCEATAPATTATIN